MIQTSCTTAYPSYPNEYDEIKNLIFDLWLFIYVLFQTSHHNRCIDFRGWSMQPLKRNETPQNLLIIKVTNKTRIYYNHHFN